MRNWRLILVGCLVFGLCAGLVQAQVVKKSQGGLDDLIAASPRLQVSQVLVQAEQLRSEAAAMAAPGMVAVMGDWDRFLTDNGPQWELQLDRRTARPALVSGSGMPWVPGAGNALGRNDIRESLGANGQVQTELTPNVADTIRALKAAGVKVGIICDVALDAAVPWQRKHLATLRHLYAKAAPAAARSPSTSWATASVTGSEAPSTGSGGSMAAETGSTGRTR